MSASSKKKLRAQQNAEQLTEKQLAAQKEEKKTQLYTTLFVVVLAVLVVVAAYAGITQRIAGSGMHERNTTAVTVGSHQISNAELNYYFIDSVNQFYSQNGSYIALYGLDPAKPLDQQYISQEEGITWADNFIATAKESARAVYAMVDEANANGFTLSEELQAQVDTVAYNLSAYATMYGYSSADNYLKAMYGNGASVEGFQKYYSMNLLSDAYRSSYNDSLTYTDQQLRDQEKDAPEQYNSYNFNQYYLSTSKFLTGGTTDEDGKTTYTDEERAAAAKAAEAAAKSLISSENADPDAFDAAIAALSVNADSNAKSTSYTNQRYTNAVSVVAKWLGEAGRTQGDMGCLESSSTVTGEDGTETTTVNGYYVVLFNGVADNNIPMVNVRHILVSFEGDEVDENGQTVYTDEAKAEAKAAAEAILADWKAGEATEDSFAALATEKTTDTGSADNGGLYENVYPGQMVSAFNNWCFDSARKSGDTGIVETEYGYHVMYFVGTSDTTYRDFLITNDLRDADFEAWYTGLIDAVSMTDGSTKYMKTNLVMNPNA